MRTTLVVLLPWWNALPLRAAGRPRRRRRGAACADPSLWWTHPYRGSVGKINTVDIWIPSVSNVGHGSEAAARGTGRAEPDGRARRGPPRVPEPGLRRRHRGCHRRGGRLLQGGRLLAVRQQGGH